ncbi:pre-mRNA-splicing ATP-dependent RNA helicase prp28 [Exophiala aquamarina CBS 119918]|uniref:Pre-mRNA-splicing ATP-dependent RNA helicase PRP28 n=1 Tax=Exophiala aquamarina CBS 119918 TaxID=1182545 RepID=A0A072PV89_9EURO|nr:pre-mRNA-splicing ATP-dependent RNA helicase prp28 [Exophiala aquamarina CBS 119918]KEF63248.1 pre-mRNA-splicing ATP-dependent RNA helicase prp28 [Exophiala aquamarina CBS 119918]
MANNMVNDHHDITIPAPPVDPIPRPQSPPPPPSTELLPPPPPPDTVLAPPPPPIASNVPPPPPDVVPPPPASELDLSADGLKPQPPKKKGWGTTKSQKATPLSVEDLLRRKREADLAASKPKFLSKAERERIALEKRAQEAEAATPSKTQNGFPRRQSSKLSTKTEPPKSNAAPKGPKAFRNGEVPTGPAAMRSRDQNKDFDLKPPAAPKSIAFSGDSKGQKRPAEDERNAHKESDLIRQRYMGAEMNVSTFSALKKRRRTTEKKFNFEWNAEEDTTPDYNPIYNNRAETNFFGRGRLGGFDEQVADAAAQKYAAALQSRDIVAGSARAQEILEMERRRKEDAGRMSIDKHWSEKKLEHMRERDWRIFKEDFNIATKGGGIPNPMRNWKESSLPPRLLEIIDQVGYVDPSPIQRAAIPIALQNRDLIGVAVTGSGKTAAFLLPLLVYISELPRLDEDDMRKNNGPYAIILAPTRELAQQIELEARKFASPLGFTVVSIVGGHSIEEQAYNLRNGAEIIIATPGRLVDCIDRRIIVLEQCCYVIMDEADRMIDLGFEEPVNKILDALPVGNEKPDSEAAEDYRAMSRHLGGKDRYRQTMMYTATMPVAVERIARKYLRRPAIVTIGNIGEAVDTVEQRVEFVAGEDKRKKRLGEILSSGEFRPPIIVFVNIKRNCDAVARDIKHMGFSSVTLHGSKTQEQREAALLSVREGKTDVLVATDLAGRGIDVPDVSLVVNFNMAHNIESYTHRIGRTGRAGKSGISITFLGNEDADVMYDLKQMLMKSSISRVPEELRKHEAAQQKTQRGGGGASKGGFNRGAVGAGDESGGFGMGKSGPGHGGGGGW